MANFGNRIIRAARLDVALYEEVEADKSALGQLWALWFCPVSQLE
ncbi:unnamed protein product [marine sediment metagenome]|uniref:Uncharacterized protein n=1 Tax=marine sediment metagenome TaxID=412755 RepID=X1BZI7_9ZZZZ